MASCTEIRSELKAFVDGELRGSLAGSVRQHVERCSACSRELSEIQSLSRRLRELDTAVPPAALRSRILAQVPVTEPERSRAPWWRMPSFALGLGTAACALLIFVLVGPNMNNAERDLAIVNQPSPAPESTGSNSEGALSEAPTLYDSVETDQARKASADKRSEVKLKEPAASAITNGRAPSGSPQPSAPAQGLPGLESSSEKFALSRTPRASGPVAEKPPEARERQVLGERIDSAAGVPAGGALSPAGPGGPPPAPAQRGGGFGESSQLSQAPAAADTFNFKAQAGRAQVGSYNAPQNLSYFFEKSETIELTVADIEGTANGIIFAAQSEGARPLLPDKKAESGADELMLMLLVPSDKIDEVKASLSPYRNTQLRQQNDLYRNMGGRARQPGQSGLRNEVDNRVYFGQMAPRDNLSLESVRGRESAGITRGQTLQKQDEQRGKVVQQEAAKLGNSVTAMPRFSTSREVSRGDERKGMDKNKKDSAEMVRLVIKLRSPSKPPATPRKNEE